ncbi:hypothetical protein OY671_013117, partial [Metschnikowia pulcherrima]
NADGFRSPGRSGRLPCRTRRLHRCRDPATGASGRQYPLLRPSPGMGAHRFRERRLAPPRMGGTPDRGHPPRRRRRPSALLRAEDVRRQGRLQPVDGGHPRTLRRQGAGPAQRSPERALDR